MEAATGTAHRYYRGEEVIVRLHGAQTHNVERASPVEEACLPAWTIGVIVETYRERGAPAYALRIEHDGCACMCLVREDAIEGLA